MKRKTKSVLVISAAVLVGLILGNFAGNALSGIIPFVAKNIQFGLDDFSMQLYVLQFHIGLMFHVNILGLVGGFIGLVFAIR